MSIYFANEFQVNNEQSRNAQRQNQITTCHHRAATTAHQTILFLGWFCRADRCNSECTLFQTEDESAIVERRLCKSHWRSSESERIDQSGFGKGFKKRLQIEMKLNGFADIDQSLLNRLALARDIDLIALCDEHIVFRPYGTK